jgi:DNA repair protein RecO (recombination protein O)
MEALVLRQVDYGEADRITTLLTAERGRVDARIPQARRSRKRFGGLDLFVLADVTLEPRPGAPRLKTARILDSHDGIRGEIERLALAGFAAELLAAVAPPDGEGADLMRLGRAAFAALDSGAPGGEGWARGFELKLLHVLGVRPSLRRCAACGEVAAPPLSWSPGSGGVLGACHEGSDPRAREVSSQTADLLDRSLRTPLSEQDQVAWGRDELRQARGLLAAFLEDHVGRGGKARRFLESVFPLLVLGLAACGTAPPTEVSVGGFLYEEPAPAAGTEALSDASGLALDDAGSELAEATRPFADFPGYFRFDALAPEQSVHAVFSGDGHIATVVAGSAAPDDLFVDAGVFHLWPRPVVEGWIDEWSEVLSRTGGPRLPALDPEQGGDGGFIRGTWAGTGTQLRALDSTGAPRSAVYRDSAGLASEEPATTVHGGFAVFGMPVGPARLQALQEGDWQDVATVLIVEDGVTSLARWEHP